MGILPSPEQLAAASGNLTRKLLREQLADLRPMPRALIELGCCASSITIGPIPEPGGARNTR